MPEINSLSDEAIRKLCRLERGSRFVDNQQSESQSIAVDQKPFRRYMITQEDGTTADRSTGALEPCGVAFARELHFAVGPAGKEVSEGCWKPCQAPSGTISFVEKVYDVHGATFALVGDVITVCRSAEGRLETFAEQGISSVDAKFIDSKWEVHRCEEPTGFTITPTDPNGLVEDQDYQLHYSRAFDTENCTDCGCWICCACCTSCGGCALPEIFFCDNSQVEISGQSSADGTHTFTATKVDSTSDPITETVELSCDEEACGSVTLEFSDGSVDLMYGNHDGCCSLCPDNEVSADRIEPTPDGGTQDLNFPNANAPIEYDKWQVNTQRVGTEFSNEDGDFEVIRGEINGSKCFFFDPRIHDGYEVEFTSMINTVQFVGATTSYQDDLSSSIAHIITDAGQYFVRAGGNQIELSPTDGETVLFTSRVSSVETSPGVFTITSETFYNGILLATKETIYNSEAADRICQACVAHNVRAPNANPSLGTFSRINYTKIARI